MIYLKITEWAGFVTTPMPLIYSDAFQEFCDAVQVSTHKETRKCCKAEREARAACLEIRVFGRKKRVSLTTT